MSQNKKIFTLLITFHNGDVQIHNNLGDFSEICENIDDLFRDDCITYVNYIGRTVGDASNPFKDYPHDYKNKISPHVKIIELKSPYRSTLLNEQPEIFL